MLKKNWNHSRFRNFEGLYATVELSVENPNESIVSPAGCSLSSAPDLSLQSILNESVQHPVHKGKGINLI